MAETFSGDEDDDALEPAAGLRARGDLGETRLRARLPAPGPAAPPERLDRALASLGLETPSGPLSRSRLQSLIREGRVRVAGAAITDPSTAAPDGAEVEVLVPAPAPAAPEPEDIPLVVLYEDRDLVVFDKPSGLVAHPGAGNATGTLVNALLHHCRGQLSGVGGVLRPGLVHRLDKDTSGVMVAAKSDAAHQGLAALFAAHDLDREYVALVRGAPVPSSGRIETRIGRARFDRQRMAVLPSGGRGAVTLYRTERAFRRADGKAAAARVRVRLETGRTHQIRVHAAHAGWPVLGDPLYGSGAPAGEVRAAIQAAGLGRQALHAARLGFVHPTTGERLDFETPPPEDMERLESELGSRFFCG